MNNAIRTSAVTLFVLLLLPAVVTGEDSVQDPPASSGLRQAMREAEQDSGVERDHLLRRTALAQAQSGDVAGSKGTLRKIVNSSTLHSASLELQQRTASGGATGADFDSLINLITSTVAPNSWDDVGGPGAIVEFPGGVFVDTQGVLRRSKSEMIFRRRADIGIVREASRQNANNDDPRRESKLRMVSLTRLQRELQLRVAFGDAPTEAMKHMAGLKEIRYLFFFPDTNDCVVAGPAGDWDLDFPRFDSPGLLLDDFVTLLRNAKTAKGRFGCSITPKRENLLATKRFLAAPTGPLKPRQTNRWIERIRQELGLQDIVVHGVDSTSHVAHVLIEADYHMKLIGMGLEPSVPDVPNYLESIEPSDVPTSLDVLRWWFTLRSQTIERSADGNAFAFSKQPVQLKSENELISNHGDRIHTGDTSALNQLFAFRFTKHFDRIAERYPVYAQLENLFKLSIVAALIQSDEFGSRVDFDPSWLIETLTTAKGEAPKEVPSIVNHRVINRRHVVVGVSGGVSVDARTAIKTIPFVKDSGLLESDQQVAEPRDEWQSERWWWD